MLPGMIPPIVGGKIPSAPTFVASGPVFTTGTSTSVTVSCPAGIANNDILILLVYSDDADPNTPSGWTAAADSPASNGAGGFGQKPHLHVFWKRTTGTESNFTLTIPGSNNTLGIVHAFRGCITTGTPIEATQSGTAGSGTSYTLTNSQSSSGPNRLLLAATAHDNDTSSAQFSGWANSQSAGMTELSDDSTTLNNGGGLGSAAGVIAAAGSVGTTTVTCASSSYQAYWSGALIPAP